MTRERLTLIAIGLLAAMAVATAQTPPVQTQPGFGARTISPGQIEKDASAILPSAGTSGASAAPTMVRNCQERPQDCTTPPSPGDRAAEGDDQRPIRR